MSFKLDQIAKDENGEVCGTHVRDEKDTQNFRRKRERSRSHATPSQGW